MNEAVARYRPNLDEAARKVLQGFAALWFLAAVAGQGLFVYWFRSPLGGRFL